MHSFLVFPTFEFCRFVCCCSVCLSIFISLCNLTLLTPPSIASSAQNLQRSNKQHRARGDTYIRDIDRTRRERLGASSPSPHKINRRPPLSGQKFSDSGHTYGVRTHMIRCSETRISSAISLTVLTKSIANDRARGSNFQLLTSQSTPGVNSRFAIFFTPLYTMISEPQAQHSQTESVSAVTLGAGSHLNNGMLIPQVLGDFDKPLQR